MNCKKILITAILLTLALLLIPVPAMAQDNASAASQYKLLIIAPQEFIDELEPLKRFKDCSGRPTILLSLTQVYNFFYGVDEPESVKRCIAHYEQSNGIEYVMLVGDVDKFPVRWRWWGWAKRNPDGTIIPGKDQRGWAVSDLYYADLYKNGTKNFDDWDSNNNGLYGEIEFELDPENCAPNCRRMNNDNIDFLPDVAVGRVPASTPEEVTTYVNKVIAYELKTMPSDTWFKKAALYTGDWLPNGNDIKDDVANYLINRGFKNTDIKRRYWDPKQTPENRAATFVNDLNNGLGVVNYLGHGSTSDTQWFHHNDLKDGALHNSGMLPVVFVGACDTGMFARLVPGEHYIDTKNQPHCGIEKGETFTYGAYPYVNVSRPDPLQNGSVVCNNVSYKFDMGCLAESFIFIYGDPPGSGGAIAFLGERSGGQSTIVDLDKHFFKAYEQGYDILGDMWKYMIEEYYAQHNLANSHTWVRDWKHWRVGHTFDEPQKLILFGDPSLIVGGAFTNTLSGSVYNGNGGPLSSYSRYHITGNVTVPAGQTLTAYPGASVLFQDGKKITAMGTGPNEGFIVNATSDIPVCFMSLAADPQSEHVVHGMKVSGQLRLRNGGEIKLH